MKSLIMLRMIPKQLKNSKSWPVLGSLGSFFNLPCLAQHQLQPTERAANRNQEEDGRQSR